MKKLLLSFGFICCTYTLIFAQNLQRLASLPPSLLEESSGLSSICIDYFRHAPTNQSYGEMGDNFHLGDYHALGGFGNVAYRGALPDGLKYLGTSNEGVPDYYKNFIQGSVREMETRPAADRSVSELQTCVWSYSVLDYFKFIDRQASNQIVEFKRARREFVMKFGLSAPDDDEEFVNEMVIIKADHIHHIQQITANPVFRPRNVQFSENGISFIQNGQRKSVEVKYNGVNYADISPYAGDIQSRVVEFYKYYHRAPQEADVCQSRQGDYKYLLTFATQGSHVMDSYSMNVPLGGHFTMLNFMETPVVALTVTKMQTAH